MRNALIVIWRSKEKPASTAHGRSWTHGLIAGEWFADYSLVEERRSAITIKRHIRLFAKRPVRQPVQQLLIEAKSLIRWRLVADQIEDVSQDRWTVDCVGVAKQARVDGGSLDTLVILEDMNLRIAVSESGIFVKAMRNGKGQIL